MQLTKVLFYFLLVLVPTGVAKADDVSFDVKLGAWISRDGSVAPETTFRRSAHGFGAIMHFVDDPSFFEKWNRPAETVHFSPVHEIHRNVPLLLLIFFSTPGVRADGSCDVAFDMRITKPDGGTYANVKDMQGTRQTCTPGGTWKATEYLKVRIEDSDPLGLYTVTASVYDKVRDIKIELSDKFQAK